MAASCTSFAPRRWTDRDDAELAGLYRAHCSFGWIACRLARSVGACWSRVHALGLSRGAPPRGKVGRADRAVEMAGSGGAGMVSGPFSADAEARLRELVARGMTNAAIGAEMRRSTSSVFHKCKKLGLPKRCAAPPVPNPPPPPPPAAAPVIAPLKKCAPPKPKPKPKPKPDRTGWVKGRSLAPDFGRMPERGEVAAAVAVKSESVACRPAAPAAPSGDLALVEGICTVGLDATCAALGLGRGAALARWRELLPRPGIAAQALLLERLRAGVDLDQGRV